ncbi:MAG: DUF58 domain-containing protein, partial [Moraxellaceae bacterium]
MKIIKRYIGDLFLSTRFYLAVGLCIAMFVAAFFVPVLFAFASFLFLVFLLLAFADYLFLFLLAKAPKAVRLVPSRLSNGDANTVQINIRNRNRFGLAVKLIDELPVQMQERAFEMQHRLKPQQHKQLQYTLSPSERGVYEFGDIQLYVCSTLGLLVRRFSIAAGQKVSVYPSYLQLRKYGLLSKTATNNEAGSQRKRKIGQSMEFEQIKDYVSGDDIRTINWKATARRGMLMVNNYVDEKSQQVYCLIDKGRLMKMPFNGLSLLDYSINAALALTNV